MRPDIPSILPTLVIGDDAHLMAQIAAIAGRRRRYLPMLDGPHFSPQNIEGEVVQSPAAHLVVCEDGDDLAQVIAANYAYALEADLRSRRPSRPVGFRLTLERRIPIGQLELAVKDQNR